MRIDPQDTIALVIDIQEKLFVHMQDKENLLQNMLKLIKGLQFLNIDFIVNEQYPKGIGHTLTPIQELLHKEKVFEKITFSCCKNEPTLEAIKKQNKKFVILFGIEAHVCVLQSALDLLENGFIPVLVVDCINSRKKSDKEVAIQRLQQEGVILSTYESLLFELCVSAKNEVFKEISKIVK